MAVEDEQYRDEVAHKWEQERAEKEIVEVIFIADVDVYGNPHILQCVAEDEAEHDQINSKLLLDEAAILRCAVRPVS